MHTNFDISQNKAKTVDVNTTKFMQPCLTCTYDINVSQFVQGKYRNTRQDERQKWCNSKYSITRRQHTSNFENGETGVVKPQLIDKDKGIQQQAGKFPKLTKCLGTKQKKQNRTIEAIDTRFQLID